VAALRKPSVAAWAVNQLARTQETALAQLFAAGDALARTQAELIAGTAGADAGALRAAGLRVREAVEGLVGAVRGLLTGDGHELTPATLERVSDTLQAAAVDAQARDLVGAGRLERELHRAGLGPDQPVGTPVRAERDARRAAELAARALRAAEADRDRAAAAARDAQEALRDATAAARAAEEALRDAEAGLAGARAQAEAAALAHRSAQEPRGGS
jgi:hypothetical protein